MLAIFSVINARLLKLPATIAYMMLSLVLAVILLVLRSIGVPITAYLVTTFEKIDFSAAVLFGLLSFLLFAGAIQLDLTELKKQKGPILLLAIVGTVISTFVIGTLMYWVFNLFTLRISYLLALTFGALISPTDPVIVISMLKRSKLDKGLKMTLMGEALFNDGLAIVLFVVVSSIATTPVTYGVTQVAVLIVQQVFGSLALGLAMGWITHYLLYRIEGVSYLILITLGLVATGYDVAMILNISGPITVVVMGLVVRNYKADHLITQQRLRSINDFWMFVDELLNATLFLLMGLAILDLSPTVATVGAGLAAIVVTLVGRFVSVAIPIEMWRRVKPVPPRAVMFLTWCGLRGGISLALALSLPESVFTSALLTATYLVVIFSIVFQGLSFLRYLKRQRGL